MTLRFKAAARALAQILKKSVPQCVFHRKVLQRVLLRICALSTCTFCVEVSAAAAMPASGVPPYAVFGIPLRIGRTFCANTPCTRRRTEPLLHAALHTLKRMLCIPACIHIRTSTGAWRVSAHRVLAQLTFIRLSVLSPSSRATQHDVAWFQSAAAQQAPSLSWATATTLPITK